MRIRLRATSIVRLTPSDAMVISPAKIARFAGDDGRALAQQFHEGGWVNVPSRTAKRLIDMGICTDAALPVPDQFPKQVSRQLGYLEALVPDGASAQCRISEHRIGVLGVGGVGANVALMLAGAGVGLLRLIDFDRVADHNLNRQLAYDTTDVGRPKVEVLRERVNHLAPAVDVEIVNDQVTSATVAESVLSDLDVLIVAADEPVNLMTDIFWAAASRGIVAVRGAVGYETGYVGPFVGRGASCWPCFERSRTQQLGERQRELMATEVTPGTWSFGPTNMLIASALAHEVLLRAVRGASQLDAQRVIIGADPFTISRIDSPECTCGNPLEEDVVEDRSK